MTVEIGGGVGTRTLNDVAREKMRTRHMAYRTEQAYLQWIRRYVVFHGRRHPRDLGAAAVEQFLSHLAVERKTRAKGADVTAPFHTAPPQSAASRLAR